MRTKDDSVELNITEPMLVNFLLQVDKLYRDWGSELIITSGSERKARHSDTSLHYAGRAVDVRIWELADVPKPANQANALKTLAKKYLTSLTLPINWIDVVLESDHIHIEWQPKYSV